MKNLKIGSMIRRSNIVIVAVLASTLTIICDGLVFFVHIALMRVWVHGLKSDICDCEVSEHIGRDASTSVCFLFTKYFDDCVKWVVVLLFSLHKFPAVSPCPTS